MEASRWDGSGRVMRRGAVLALVALAGACGGNTSEPSAPAPDPGQPTTPVSPHGEIGDSEFYSADAPAGSRSRNSGEDMAGGGGSGGASPTADGNDPGATVEQGDIYKVLGDGRILNLNSFRGLQIIDVADPASPRIIGRLPVTGTPVELYTVGDRAYVLVNNWQTYYGSRDDIAVDSFSGGLVLAVDLTDPTSPRVTGEAPVQGYILASRLTRASGQEALFVVANEWEYLESETNPGVSEYRTTARVRSFSVSETGDLVQRSSIDLEGYLADIQATPQHLLVARNDWNGWNGTSVAVIDISDPAGTMVEGADVQVEGYVRNKTNMDVYNGILRVVSGSMWGNTTANHVQTWDIRDLQNPVAVDHDLFGEGEDLYATIFLGNKAFFVTYRRTDPFHAFEIDDFGNAVEHAEYVISGWNDFFKPVFDQRRIVGIGMNDQAGRSLAVSLYDITDLANPDPFISRAEVAATDYSWSEAQWDDRAFSVLENAVSVAGPGGVVETGLVLLPFSGYDSSWSAYRNGVQIFTFSETTLTRRGLMDVGGYPVRRSFLVEPGTTGNLSESTLALFDTNDPDAPAALGSVELAPNYADFFVFGEHGARVKSPLDWWGYYYDPARASLRSTVEIVPLSDHPDEAAAVASFEVAAFAQLYQVGDLLVAAETHYVDGTTPARFDTTLEVFDLSDPARPRAAGTLRTDRIEPFYGSYYYGYGYGPMADCFDCGYWYGYAPASAKAVGSALVFPRAVQEQELVGVQEDCTTYPFVPGNNYCWDYNTGLPIEGCTYDTGGITCTSLDGALEQCYGELYRCETHADYQSDCQPIDASQIQTQESCYSWDRYRYWFHYSFDVLDLRDPDAPALAPALDMATEEEGVSLLADGSDLYVTYKTPVQLPIDPRPFVQFYFRKIELADPVNPVQGPGINVPGELLAVDGADVFTRDFVWGQTIVETTLNKLHVSGSRAYLDAFYHLPDEEVHAVKLDGAGHVLLTHRESYQSHQYDPNYRWDEVEEKLTILAVSDLDQLSEIGVDSWASFQDAQAGRALFTVPGGLLVFDVSDAANPVAQSFFPTVGWPTRLVLDAEQIYFAAGPYGVYRFDLDEFNLRTR